jgi:hypothetical protein
VPLPRVADAFSSAPAALSIEPLAAFYSGSVTPVREN